MNKFTHGLQKFWRFLKQDTWQSWIVSLVLAFIFIKFIFFPILSWGFATKLPLVIVESCSMYHSSNDFDSWWTSNGGWYENRGISKADFEKMSFHNGLNKGDIVFVTGRGGYNVGNILIFNSNYQYPLIHRLIRTEPFDTKGDNNPSQLPAELDIQTGEIVGKAWGKIPGLGWIKLIFFEGTKPEGQRGFCK